jgi:regulator of protease activity HflC (stomatin/prohibitin superfamily)
MDLPQYGDVDLSVPTQANLEMSRRMAQRQADLKRQQERDRSPLEKVAGALQTGRLMGSALTQAINSMPTRIAKGDAAADQFMQEYVSAYTTLGV